jgi:hypothetical protein
VGCKRVAAAIRRDGMRNPGGLVKRLFLVLLACVGLVHIPESAASTFGRPQHLTGMYFAQANVAIGDVDGDGRKDLAVTDVLADSKNRLSVYFQQADGSLSSPVTVALPFAAGFAYPVVVVDLDHNGRGETIVGRQNGGLIVVSWRNGRKPFIFYQSGPVNGCAFIATGDIDGDGNADIACHSGYQAYNYAAVFYGDGRGFFRTAPAIPTQAGHEATYDLKSVQLADVTGDGRTDMVITASSSDKFYVFPNDGHGGFLAPLAYAHPASSSGTWPAALVVADVDGDGKNEVVTASPDSASGNGMLNIYRQGAGGSLALSTQTSMYYSATALLAGDAGGDGGLDLVSAHYGVNSASVIGVGSGGSLSQPVRFELPGFGNDYTFTLAQGSNSLALGDLNGDGCSDLAAGTFTGVTLLYGCQPYKTSLPVNDLDGDGISDLIWRLEPTGEVIYWRWGLYDCPRMACPMNMGQNFKQQAIGDFDGDGASDLFWRDPSTGKDYLNLQGKFKQALTTVTGAEWQVVGAGDFDGDDKSDLLWRNTQTGANSIWKSANSNTHQDIAALADLNWKVAGIGDFDGDGRSDIFWRNSANGSNAIWKAANSGDPLPAATVTDLNWKVVAIADFNGDGKDDVAWRHSGTGSDTIWLSANQATQQATTKITDQNWKILSAGDYNGDGRADLTWRNTSTGANAIWLSGNSKTQLTVPSYEPAMTLMH